MGDGKGKGDRKGKDDKGDRKGKGKDDKGDRKGKGKGKRDLEEGEIEEIVQIPNDDVGDDFPLRAKLIGENGCNVKHVETQTKTKVSVRHISGQLSFVITGFDQDAISEARTNVEDLMEAVLDEAKE